MTHEMRLTLVMGLALLAVNAASAHTGELIAAPDEITELFRDAVLMTELQ